MPRDSDKFVPVVVTSNFRNSSPDFLNFCKSAMSTTPFFDVWPIQFALLDRENVFDICAVFLTKPADFHYNNVLCRRNKCRTPQQVHGNPAAESLQIKAILG